MHRSTRLTFFPRSGLRTGAVSEGNDRLYVLGALYYSLAALLGGEDIEWVTWPAKILRLGMLFTVLVLVATYTANLAAFFLEPPFIVLGPSSVSEMKQVNLAYNIHDDAFENQLKQTD